MDITYQTYYGLLGTITTAHNTQKVDAFIKEKW